MPTASPKDEGEYFCTPRNEVGGGTTESIYVQLGSKSIFLCIIEISIVRAGKVYTWGLITLHSYVGMPSMVAYD